MNFSYEFTLNIVQFMAVFSRMSGLFMGFPLFRSEIVPMQVKVVVILMTSILILPGLPAEWSSAAFSLKLDIYSLMALLVVDFLIGLTVSLTVNLLLEVTSLAGEFISTNLGYSMSKQMDPNSGEENMMIGFMLSQLMFIIFLTMDLHLVFIKIAAASFQHSAPGENVLTYDHLNTVVVLGGEIFIYSLQMALPIVAVMFILNICMGIISRFGQDFQVLMLGIPIRLGVGLMLLIALMPAFVNFFSVIYDEIFDKMGDILHF